MGFYGGLSRKQVGVIYASAKRGEIQLSDVQIKWMYDNWAEVKVHYNDNDHDIYEYAKEAITLIFSKDFEKAQEQINHAFRLECVLYGGSKIEELKNSMSKVA